MFFPQSRLFQMLFQGLLPSRLTSHSTAVSRGQSPGCVWLPLRGSYSDRQCPPNGIIENTGTMLGVTPETGNGANLSCYHASAQAARSQWKAPRHYTTLEPKLGCYHAVGGSFAASVALEFRQVSPLAAIAAH